MSSESRERHPVAPSLDTRLALRPREAAAALGISERKLRDLLPELPHVRAQGVVLLPVEAVRRWLEERSREEPGRVDATVSEILGSFCEERDTGYE